MYWIVCWTMGKNQGKREGLHRRLTGNSFDVVVTVRSVEKGQRLVKSIDQAVGKQVSFVVVEDIAAEGAFDEVKASASPRKNIV